MISRRDFIASLSAAGAAASCSLAATPVPAHRPAQDKPNILIFMPDQQQGATVLPNNPCITPGIDRFAREGLLFRNAFCPAPHCCPSRASFMTGLYPSEHGVFNNVDTDTAIHVDPYPGTRFFSQSLRDAGYNLSYSGKWHVGRTLRPEHVGWQVLNPEAHTASRLGADHQLSHWAVARAELAAPRPRTPGEVIRQGWGNLQLFGSSAVPFHQRRDYTIVQQGIAGMQQLAQEQAPWCVMISNDGGHDVYDPPREFLAQYDWRKIQLPPSFRDRMRDKPRIYQRMRLAYWDQLSDDEVKMAIAHYYALLTMQDALFGQILDALDATGQADNTLVVYCSDHGDYAGAHGLWAKGVPAFREAYNIPCVIRWPKAIADPGRTLDAYVSTVDFAPTILEAAAAPRLPTSGVSLLPWFSSATVPDWRDTIHAQLNGTELYYTQRSVTTGAYKYVYNGFDFDEMYDLERDPYEEHNLLDAVASHPSATCEANQPWPKLPAELDHVRCALLQRMWNFAREHNDQIFNDYLTVAMAPYGPGVMT